MRDSNLNDIRLFVQVVESGSFSVAARSLCMAKSSVSRGIARLEEHMDTQLLQRTTRVTMPTDAGMRYYDLVAPALSALDQAHEAIASPEEPQGVIRLVAPPGVGSEALPRLVALFVRRHPKVSVEVNLSAQDQPLVAGRFDLAIRGGVQPDSSLTVRKLGESVFRLYASAEYLAQAGTPGHIDQLRTHHCVVFRPERAMDVWSLQKDAPSSPVHHVRVTGQISSNELVVVRRCAIAGAGIALLPEIPASLAVRQNLLVPVLPQYAMRSSPLFVVYPSTDHLPRRVRLFCDFLVESFLAPENFDHGTMDW